MRFLGKKVTVELNALGKVPEAVVLGSQRYRPLELVAQWRDYGFGRVPMPSRNWRMRHNRNYYLLMTEDGETLELYRNLPTPKGSEWVLYRIYETGEVPLREKPKIRQNLSNRSMSEGQKGDNDEL